MSEIQVKPKSRRGRKPKIKTDQPEMIVKKKRGRKKKCEMNLENIPKISGYNPNGESIDTEDNKIKFNSSNSKDIPQECENLSFGILQIKRHNVIRTSEENETPEEIIYNNSKCKIRFDWIEEIKTIETKTNETIEKNSNNLSNFLDVNPIGKIINYNKPKDSKMKKKQSITSKNNNNYIKILSDYKTIPKKTDILCWWCCHKFDGIPRFMPTKYDPVRQRFRVTGNFCSWPCVRTYMEDERRITNTLLLKLVWIIHGKRYDINKAPPRQTLKRFGGRMTIDEFRNNDPNVYYEVNTNRITMDDNYYIKECKKR